jgi:ribonucleotide reductase alpha subunit
MIITEEFIEKYSNLQPPWGYNGLGEIVYARTYSREIPGCDRKERWHETIMRCINGAQEIGAEYSKEEAERLYDHMFHMRGLFSGRSLWQLGTKIIDKVGGPSLLNCYYTDISSIEDFEFIMLHLAFGGGVGYSVERSKIHELPRIKRNVNVVHMKTNDADFIVPDSREGWVSLLHEILTSFFITGKSFTYSTILVRGYGAKLETFGGTASGPEALVEGMSDICKTLKTRENKKLRSIDALDLANIIGRVIVAGSARRSAQLAIGDPDDTLFLRAKNWNSGDVPAWRANSNNSIYADKYEAISDEFWKGYDGGGEPYGLINLPLSRKTGRLNEKVNDGLVSGFNPCGEIGLENKGVCNLSEIFLPNVSSKDDLIDISKLLYKTQKAITNLKFPNKETDDITKKYRRLGLGMTGWLQASKEQISWVSDAYANLRKYDAKFSEYKGINESIKITTVKPSGCRPWNSLTTTSRGILTMQEMFVNHKEGEVWSKSSDFIVREDGKYRVSKTYDNGSSEIMKIKLLGGYELESTKEHQWFVSLRRSRSYGGKRHDKVDQWVQTKDLKHGDVIETSVGLYKNHQQAELLYLDERSLSMRCDATTIKQPKFMSDDLAWLLGYMWGDGSQSPAHWRIRFSDKDERNLNQVNEIMYNIFGISSEEKKRSSQNSSDITFASVYLWHWFIKNGFWKYAMTGKSLELIPMAIRSSSRSNIISFISGLIDAEGGFYNRIKKAGIITKKAAILITNSDGEFMKHLQNVALSVGLVMSRVVDPCKSKKHFGGPMNRLNIRTGRCNVDSMEKLISMSIKGRRFIENGGEIGTKECGPPVGEVSEVSFIGKGDTFDIEVPDGNFYYAGAFKSHNTLSLLAGVTPGIHPAYASYYIRRIRMGSNDPLVSHCRKSGYRVQYDIGIDGREDHSRFVIDFPCSSPKNAILAKDLSAVDQMEYVKTAQTLWADNAVSCTVYYSKDELPAIKDWLKENYENSIKSISFLLRSDHGFNLPPYEEIDESKYNEMVSKINKDYKETYYGDGLIQELECDGGACPIK